jgi:hypothetical protein
MKIKSEGDLAILAQTIKRTEYMGEKLRLAHSALNMQGAVARAKLGQLGTKSALDHSRLIYQNLMNAEKLSGMQPGLGKEMKVPIGVSELPLGMVDDQIAPAANLAWGQIQDPSNQMTQAARAAVKEKYGAEIQQTLQMHDPGKAQEYEQSLVYHELLLKNQERIANGDGTAIEELARVRESLGRKSPVGMIPEILGGKQ